jgi:hypothetical protein
MPILVLALVLIFNVIVVPGSARKRGTRQEPATAATANSRGGQEKPAEMPFLLVILVLIFNIVVLAASAG